MNVKFSVDALADIEEAYLHYLRQSTTRAATLRSAVRQTGARIADAPRRGTPGARGTRKILLNGFPYWIHYRVLESEIEVVAVAHTSRDPEYWLERLT